MRKVGAKYPERTKIGRIAECAILVQFAVHFRTDDFSFRREQDQCKSPHIDRSFSLAHFMH
jgi:hypothetical protein